MDTIIQAAPDINAAQNTAFSTDTTINANSETSAGQSEFDSLLGKILLEADNCSDLPAVDLQNTSALDAALIAMVGNSMGAAVSGVQAQISGNMSDLSMAGDAVAQLDGKIQLAGCLTMSTDNRQQTIDDKKQTLDIGQQPNDNLKSEVFSLKSEGLSQLSDVDNGQQTSDIRHQAVDDRLKTKESEVLSLKSSESNVYNLKSEGLSQWSTGQQIPDKGQLVTEHGSRITDSGQRIMDIRFTELLDNAIYTTRGSNRLEVSIDHASLGKLNMDLSVEKGLLNIHINTAEKTLGNLIENNIQHIIDSLAKEGISIGGFSVSFRDRKESSEDMCWRGDNVYSEEFITGKEINNVEGLVNIFV